MGQDEKDLEGEERVEKKPGGKHVAPSGRRGLLPTPAWVVICALLLALGVFAGHYLLGGTGSISLNGRTTLSAGELDSVIATYTVNGQAKSVTAREVLVEVAGGAEPIANEDGTYDVPSASATLTYAQNEIILADAAACGITATDEEIDEFAISSLGADLATLASSWGIEEQAAHDMIEDAIVMQKLQEQVTSTELPEQPSTPSEPAEGEEDVATAEYAQYVIGLLGDEWDAEADDWARTDGTYYATLSGYEISNESATYAAASAAYSVAASAYEEAYNQVTEELGAYTDGLLSKATIQIGTLVD